MALPQAGPPKALLLLLPSLVVVVSAAAAVLLPHKHRTSAPLLLLPWLTALCSRTFSTCCWMLWQRAW